MLTEEKDDIWVPNSRFHWQEMWVSRTCVSTVSAETKPAVSQPRSHFHGLRKSLAVARNPRRHIFNLSLRYRRVLTHSTWIMCTTILFTRISLPGKHEHHEGLFSNFSISSRAAKRSTYSKCLSHCHAPSFWLERKTSACVRCCLVSGEFFLSTNVCVRVRPFRCELKLSRLVPH